MSCPSGSAPAVNYALLRLRLKRKAILVVADVFLNFSALLYGNFPPFPFTPLRRYLEITGGAKEDNNQTTVCMSNENQFGTKCYCE